MIYVFNGVEIHYKLVGKKKGQTNVFLHGWGRNLKDFEKISSEFPNHNNVLIDLPPFGSSGKISGWSFFTYSNMLKCLLRHLKVEKCNLIGHSFGGRVAVFFASFEREMVDKLVLVSSAGIKPKRSLKFRFKLVKIKILKLLKKDVSRFSSKDYFNLDDDMKKTFISIVTTHLEDYAKFIEAETLIIYGENDAETPIYMANRFHKLIKNSRLVIMKDAGHFPFIERKLTFAERLIKFLN